LFACTLRSQYRLCKRSTTEALTEKCFQSLPLDFDRSKQALLMNNGTRYPLKGIYVDGNVTWPRGSTWARNPVPRQGENSIGATRPNKTSTAGWVEFPPPCPWDCSGQADCPNPGTADHPGTQENYAGCSGDWRGGQIVDTVLIPKGIEPGQWVLGFRWDCEVRKSPICLPVCLSACP
jgi:lytic starch monooxygenase